MTVYVYGTLRKGYGNNSLMKGGILLSVDRLKGWNMFTHGGFPWITRGTGEITAELWWIPDGAIHAVDSLEGEGLMYHREKIRTPHGTKAFIYVAGEMLTAKKSIKIKSGDWEVFTRGVYELRRVGEAI